MSRMALVGLADTNDFASDKELDAVVRKYAG